MQVAARRPQSRDRVVGLAEPVQNDAVRDHIRRDEGFVFVQLLRAAHRVEAGGLGAQDLAEPQQDRSAVHGHADASEGSAAAVLIERHCGPLVQLQCFAKAAGPEVQAAEVGEDGVILQAACLLRLFEHSLCRVQIRDRAIDVVPRIRDLGLGSQTIDSRLDARVRCAGERSAGALHVLLRRVVAAGIISVRTITHSTSASRSGLFCSCAIASARATTCDCFSVLPRSM